MKWFFNIIINLLATIIQIVTLPINLAITSAMPNISNAITSATSTISTLFNSMGWILSGIPTAISTALLIILGIEIAKHTIFLSTHVLIKVWNLFQKLKFW